MHAGLSIEASQDYKTLQSLESKILLNDLLDAKKSEQYALHVRRWVVLPADTDFYSCVPMQICHLYRVECGVWSTSKGHGRSDGERESRN